MPGQQPLSFDDDQDPLLERDEVSAEEPIANRPAANARLSSSVEFTEDDNSGKFDADDFLGLEGEVAEMPSPFSSGQGGESADGLPGAQMEMGADGQVELSNGWLLELPEEAMAGLEGVEGSESNQMNSSLSMVEPPSAAPAATMSEETVEQDENFSDGTLGTPSFEPGADGEEPFAEGYSEDGEFEEGEFDEEFELEPQAASNSRRKLFMAVGFTAGLLVVALQVFFPDLMTGGTASDSTDVAEVPNAGNSTATNQAQQSQTATNTGVDAQQQTAQNQTVELPDAGTAVSGTNGNQTATTAGSNQPATQVTQAPELVGPERNSARRAALRNLLGRVSQAAEGGDLVASNNESGTTGMPFGISLPDATSGESQTSIEGARFEPSDLRVVPAASSTGSGLIWTGSAIPMEQIESAARVQTPAVGIVRATMISGEVFEGRLVAVGESRIWVDVGSGRLGLDGKRLESIDRLAEPDADVELDVVSPGQRVRVRTPGGVLYGKVRSVVGEEVTLVTDKGGRITLVNPVIEPIGRLSGLVSQP